MRRVKLFAGLTAGAALALVIAHHKHALITGTGILITVAIAGVLVPMFLYLLIRFGPPQGEN